MRTLTLQLTPQSLAMRKLGASARILDFAALTPAQLQSRFGWVRSGAGTLTDSGSAVRYGAHNFSGNSEDFSQASWAAQAGLTKAPAALTFVNSTSSVQQNNSGVPAGDLFFRIRLSCATGPVSLRIRIADGADGNPDFFQNITVGTEPADFVITGNFPAASFSGVCAVLLMVNGTIPAGTVVNVSRSQICVGALTEHVTTPTAAAAFLMRTPDYTHGVPGLLLEGGRTQLLESGAIGAQLVTQTKTVTAVAHTLSFFGTGTVTLTGAHSATVVGTGATTLRTFTFTPSAGSLTLTVTGTVTDGQLEAGSYATSRIPNATTGTLLRVADVAEIGPGPEFDALFGLPTFGANLVTNGDGSSTSGWTSTGAVSLSVSSGNLVATLVRAGSNTNGRYFQDVAVGANKRYQLDLTGSQNTTSGTGGAAFYLNDGANFINFSGQSNLTSTPTAITRQIVPASSTVRVFSYLDSGGLDGTTTTAVDNVLLREVIREGTIVVEWVDTGSTDGDILALHSNGTTNELLSLYYSGSSILTLCRAGSANQLAATVGTRIPNALNKAAISWGAAGLSVVLNGGTVQANASATIPAPTHARIAGTALASSAQGARKLTRITPLTTQRTGAALQALTV